MTFSLEFNLEALLNPSSILFLFLFTFALKWFHASLAKKKNQPPSPSKLPIIGNLHQIGMHPQHTLRALALRHGPLMKLHLGSAPAYVVTSAELAAEVIRTHDVEFSNRKDTKVYRRLLYDSKELLLVPYSEYWRQMRSICVVHLLNTKRVQSFQSVRQEEVDFLIEKIKHTDGTTVDLSYLLSALMSDVACRAAFGRKYTQGSGALRIKSLFEEFAELLGVFNIGEFIPWLDWINHVNGLYARVEKNFRELDQLLNEIIDDYVKSPTGDDHQKEHHLGVLDILLDLQKNGNINGVAIDKDNIKAITLDVLAGGSDTTFATLEWAMSEMIRNPEVINKLQNEIRGIIGSKAEITTDDLDKMAYLKAIIKETLRLHPPVPIIARMSTKDVEIQGYTIGANTRVFINAMAIGRDPGLWEDAEKFMPERFLENNSFSTNFIGQDFRLIPFGGGRRGCPGIAFAIAVIEPVLANLIHKFDWSLPGGAAGEKLDLKETSGLSVHRKNSLVLVATPRLAPSS